jgi:hypothetical protein
MEAFGGAVNMYSVDYMCILKIKELCRNMQLMNAYKEPVSCDLHATGGVRVAVGGAVDKPKGDFAHRSANHSSLQLSQYIEASR